MRNTRPSPATAIPSDVDITIPAPTQRARTAWRRLITAADEGGTGARALSGTWLDAGETYRTPVGAVILLVERHGSLWHVTMTRVTADQAAPTATGQLQTLKEWEQKSPLGKRVVDYVRRRLTDDAQAHTARRVSPQRNRRPGICPHCKNGVPAGQGILVSVDATTRAAHRDGECPPPPEVLTPNRYAEHCLWCGLWVPAGTGEARRLANPNPVTGSHYRAAHTLPCPDDALPGPVNRHDGWCVLCRELAPPGQGYWDLDDAGPGKLRHIACPEPTVAGPTWIVRPEPSGTRPAPGQAHRVTVDLRGGIAVTEGASLTSVTNETPSVLSHRHRTNPQQRRALDNAETYTYRRPDNPPVPDTVPGWRMRNADQVELIGVILETRRSSTGTLHARVRAASSEEAAPVLAAEVASAAGARPDAGAFSAAFTVTMRAGQRPWLAEITGRHPDYRLARRFLRPTVDWTHSNSRGTAGAQYGWVLRPNTVYETRYAYDYRHEAHEFLRVSADGDIVTITREEALTWLDAAPLWPDH